MKQRYAATCLFGIEGLLADELRNMGASEVASENGRVLFSGGWDILCRANICSRFAERIMIFIGSFTAKSFDELFDGVKSLPWENYIGRDNAFPVKGWSINSALHSIPDCQSIIKKAVVDRLKSKYAISWFKETGALCRISFSILKNTVTLYIDTSGEGLHKRGYRAKSNAAPIKETLAAAMAALTRIYDDSQVYDPFCGSGTILIESAMIAVNKAPGVQRHFAAEHFDMIDREIWHREREKALSEEKRGAAFAAHGSDIDDAAVKLTLNNARKAGVDRLVRASQADIRDFALGDGQMIKVITNPPYGERIADKKEAQTLYRIMGEKFERAPGRRYSIISPDERFETLFGRPADKRRKLYNGMIQCNLYMYFKVK